MGARFRYVADEAMDLVVSSMMPKCHICKQMVTETFNYPEDVVLPDKAEDNISQVCATCLNAGPSVSENPWLMDAVCKHYGTKAKDGGLKEPVVAEALSRLARTPRPVMAQGTDWPLCCKDFCELYGAGDDDEDLSKQTAGMIMWDWGPKRIALVAKLLKGQPEFGSDLHFFRCTFCRKRYFTFQPT
jgi:uncharacterized protein CbrC (UPF0167 family)